MPLQLSFREALGSNNSHCTINYNTIYIIAIVIKLQIVRLNAAAATMEPTYLSHRCFHSQPYCLLYFVLASHHREPSHLWALTATKGVATRVPRRIIFPTSSPYHQSLCLLSRTTRRSLITMPPMNFFFTSPAKIHYFSYKGPRGALWAHNNCDSTTFRGRPYGHSHDHVFGYVLVIRAWIDCPYSATFSTPSRLALSIGQSIDLSNPLKWVSARRFQ